MEDSDFSTRFRELASASSATSWGADLQHFCIQFWDTIQGPLEIDDWPQTHRLQIQSFCDLLLKPDAYTLATYVVPDLREPGPGRPSTGPRSLSPAQRLVYDTVRARLAKPPPTTQQQAADAAFDQEKAIFAEAEVYWACLLLTNTGTPSAAKEDEVREWLSKAPR